MTEILLWCALWAYTLRAAWTGGVIKGYGEPIQHARFAWSVVFWPVIS